MYCGQEPASRKPVAGGPTKLTGKQLTGVLMRLMGSCPCGATKNTEKLSSGLLLEFSGKLPARMPLKVARKPPVGVL